MVRRALIVAVIALGAPLVQPGICSAAENQATLIVESAETKTQSPKTQSPKTQSLKTQSLCVGFEGETTTALDLLERSGLGIRYQDFGGGNVFVCKIGAMGCDYPKESCTCEYAGKKTFWGMYLREGDRWTFAQTGAAVTDVRDGAVVGWRWGTHDGENDPPSIAVASRCDAIKTVPAADRTSSSTGIVAVAIVVLASIVATAWIRARRTREVVE